MNQENTFNKKQSMFPKDFKHFDMPTHDIESIKDEIFNFFNLNKNDYLFYDLSKVTAYIGKKDEPLTIILNIHSEGILVNVLYNFHSNNKDDFYKYNEQITQKAKNIIFNIKGFDINVLEHNLRINEFEPFKNIETNKLTKPSFKYNGQYDIYFSLNSENLKIKQFSDFRFILSLLVKIDYNVDISDESYQIINKYNLFNKGYKKILITENGQKTMPNSLDFNMFKSGTKIKERKIYEYLKNNRYLDFDKDGNLTEDSINYILLNYKH